MTTAISRQDRIEALYNRLGETCDTLYRRCLAAHDCGNTHEGICCQIRFGVVSRRQWTVGRTLQRMAAEKWCRDEAARQAAWGRRAIG